MRRRIAVWHNSDFFRNVSKVASGTAIAQAITLGAMPLLTRLYDPEAFGIYGVMMAVATPLVVLVNGRYDLAIVLPREDSAAAALHRLALRIAIVISVILAVLAFLGRGYLSNALGIPAFTEFYWFIPLFALFTGWSQAQSNWVLRRKEFGRLTKSAPLAATVSSSLLLVLGLISGVPACLLIGNLASPFVSAAYLSRASAKELAVFTQSRTDLNVASEYREFPLYRAPQDLLNAVSQNVIGVLLAYYFSPAAMAQYWLAHRVIAAPLSLISSALGQVFYQRAASIVNEGGNLYPELRDKTIALVGISLPLFAVISLIVPFVFPHLFGIEWVDAGYAGSWLSLWFGTMFINTPAMKALDVYRLQKAKLIFGVFVLVLRVTVVIVFSLHGNFLQTIAAFCVLGALLNILLVGATLMYSMRKGAKLQT